MLIDHIREATTAARSTRAVDEVARILWRAVAEGHVTDADASAAAEAVEARRAALRSEGPGRQERPPAARQRAARPQRSPDRARSIERRRRLAASGPLPPAIAAHFTTGELAALRIVADEVRAHGSCTRTIAELAARAGVGRTSVQNALRRAATLGLVTVTERRLTAWRNDSNVVRVVSPEWRTWLRIGGREGGRVQNFRPHGSGSTSEVPPTIRRSRGEGGAGLWMKGRRAGGRVPPSPLSGI